MGERSDPLRHFGRFVIGASALSVLFVVWVSVGIGGDTATRAFDDITELIVALAAGVVCVVAARQVKDGSRRAWTVLGASCIAWGVGQGVWSYYELVRDVKVPFPSLADGGFILAIPLAVWALVGFAGSTAATGGRLRNLLDGLIVAGSVLTLGWVTALGGTFHHASGSLGAQVISLAYPLGDVVIATIAIVALVRAPVSSRSPLALIGAGLLSLAVADTAFAYLTQIGTYDSSNSVLDAGWVVGYLLIGLAALRAPRLPERGERPRPTLAARSRILIPYIPLVFAVAASMVKARRGQPGPFLAWTLATIALLVLVRQLATLFENVDLIAELQISQDELRRLAFHDDLTGLANRSLFWDRVKVALARRQRDERGVGLLMCDLDDFKHINDTLGHAAGDALLVAVAERLRACVRPGDTPARFGGDEFAIMLDGVDRPDTPTHIAQRIMDAMRAPFRIDDGDVVATMSIGLAQTEDPDITADDLLRDADTALYLAKHHGKNRFEVSGVLTSEFPEARMATNHPDAGPSAPIATGLLRDLL